ncbi:MAG: sensor histidine kinase [Lachnospiraceae bacterium]|nr:sensor histidine kinase [Lachnospiraceae bacterium]
MMTEIALNVHDVAENSTRAKATLVEISVLISQADDILTIIIKDNGCGMSEEQVRHVTDPFFTTRTTRSVGLGVPFFKMAAECTGGSFNIDSTIGVGTTVTAVFVLSSIDRMPLGDINCTIHSLITFNADIDFIYTYRFNDREFILDTRQFREILGDVPLNSYEVSEYIKEYLAENKLDTDGGVVI